MAVREETVIHSFALPGLHYTATATTFAVFYCPFHFHLSAFVECAASSTVVAAATKVAKGDSRTSLGKLLPVQCSECAL